MTKRQEAYNAVSNLIGILEPRFERIKGVLGFPGNTVDASVTGRPNFVYFQEDGNPSKLHQAFNNKVSPIPGLPVIAGRDNVNPAVIQILDIDIASIPNWLGRSFLQQHHKTHELGSVDSADNTIDNDVVFVQKGQMVPLALRPDDPASLRLYVFADYYNHRGEMQYFEGDYTEYFAPHPVPGSSYYITISLDGEENEISYVTGASFSVSGSGTPWRENIPDPLTGTYPLGAIRMDSDLTTVGYDTLIPLLPYHETLGSFVSGNIHQHTSDLDGGYLMSGLNITGDVKVAGDVRVGERTYYTGSVSGMGNYLRFSGGPSFNPTWGSDNSDPLWLSRANIATNQTELRMNVGDNDVAVDAFVIGWTYGGMWNPVYRMDMLGSFTQEPYGFPDRTTSTISFVNGTRTFTIAPTGASFNVRIDGVLIEKTAESVIVPDVTDLYHIRYNSSAVLVAETSEPDLHTEVPVATLYWNVDDGAGMLHEERHGTIMDLDTHEILHNVYGTQIASGFAMSGYTLSPAVPADADNTYAIAAGVAYDEDIRLAITALADGGPYLLMYRIGAAGIWSWDTDVLPFWYGVNYIQYNQFVGGAWQLTEITNGEYCNYYVVVSNATTTSHEFMLFPGQEVYSSLADALQENIGSQSLDKFVASEVASLYQVTLRGGAGYGSTGKCRIESVVQIIGSLNVIVAGASPSSHAALNDRDLPAQHLATAISPEVTNFNRLLGVTDTDVQEALETLDDIRVVSDAATNSVSVVSEYLHITSDTPLAGFGVRHVFKLEDDGGNEEDAAAVDVIWIDPTDNDEDAKMKFSLQFGGAGLTEILMLSMVETIFNETGEDVNFRIEGSTDAELFFVDAGANRVGIGTNGPVKTFDVNGTAIVQGTSHTGLTVLNTSTSSSRAGFRLEVRQTAHTGDYFIFSMRGDQPDLVMSVYDSSTTTFHQLITYNYLNNKVSFGVNNFVGIGVASPASLLELGCATEDLEIVDAGSAGATEQDWIEVEVNGVTGYIRVFNAK